MHAIIIIKFKTTRKVVLQDMKIWMIASHRQLHTGCTVSHHCPDERLKRVLKDKWKNMLVCAPQNVPSDHRAESDKHPLWWRYSSGNLNYLFEVRHRSQPQFIFRKRLHSLIEGKTGHEPRSSVLRSENVFLPNSYDRLSSTTWWI